MKSENINLDTCLAKCEYCHAITYFGDEMRPSHASAEEYHNRDWLEQKDKVERHARFQVEEWGNELTVRYSWFTWGVLFLLVFCVIWDGFLVVWYGIGLSAGAPWIMLVFPLLHVAVGAGLTYFVICCFVNSTTIRVTDGEIAVNHGPLPCGQSQRVTTAELEQLFCKMEVSRNKNGNSYKYHVMARITGGSDKKLISGFDDASQAVYLERLIEKHLRIEDRVMSGEHRS